MNYLRKIVFCLAIALFYLSLQTVTFADTDVNIIELTKQFEKTGLEDDNEYRNRVKPLLATFNQAVDQRDTTYAAGQVILNDKLYDITTGVFALKVAWTDWAMLLTVIENGMIKVSRDEAKSLFENSAGQALPVFMTLILGEKEPLPEKFLLLGNGKQYEILLGGGAGTPSDLLNPKKDPFESEAQFQARRQHLLNYYNASVEKRDPAFQAGTAILNKSGYDVKTGKFPISIEWQGWAKELSIISMDYIIAEQNKAIALWREGKEKSVFVEISSDNSAKPSLIGLGKMWGIKVVKVGEVFQDRLKDGSLGPKMVMIPAGDFMMGNNDYDNEKPVHKVTLKAFAVGQYEVMFEEYDTFCEAMNKEKPHDYLNSGRGNRPVVNVNWNDAVAYTEWLSEQTGHTYRLLTEAEWEYASRAGSETKYWWGNNLGGNQENCNNSHCEDGYEYTSSVGSFSANPFGLYDTVGNVSEWTCSAYTDKYGSGEEQRCVGKNSNKEIVSRGYSFLAPPDGTLSTDRLGGVAFDIFIGFRVARALR